jgi:hypothetical protein
MATAAQSRRIYFLPFFPLESELRVGDTLFWPFYQLKDTLIPDEGLRRDLERIFSCYVDHRGQILETITIASLHGPDLSPLSTDEEQYLDAAVKAVAFASIVKNVYRFQYRNSENFQVYTQELIPNQEEITLTYHFRRAAYGGYVHRQGPFPLTQTRFTQPQSVLLSGTRELDGRLLAGCGRVIEARAANQNAERITRSLEWFYFSHFDLRDIPDTAAAVMMSTAFETLFDLPENGKTERFIRSVEELLVTRAAGFLDAVASARNRRMNWRNTPREYNNAGWWAHNFYNLRSSIVHGSRWQFLHNGRSHLEIADLVFIECLKRKLQENGYYSYSAEDEEFRKEIYQRINL